MKVSVDIDIDEVNKIVIEELTWHLENLDKEEDSPLLKDSLTTVLKYYMTPEQTNDYFGE